MRLLIILISVFLSFGLYAQHDTIRVENGSFEDYPRAGGTVTPAIKQWYDCGKINFPGESSPDIHPIDFWEVKLSPSDGKTYLGLVVRDNDTWESVSQILTKPIKSGKCYEFSVDLARSERYLSGSRSLKGNQKVQFTRPTVFKVWGSNHYCVQEELIAESEPIKNFNWETYDFEFKAENSHLFVTLEVFYDTPVLFPYNGHVLVDAFSDFVELSCDGEEEKVAVVEKPKPKKKPEPKPEVEKEEPVIADHNVVNPQPKLEKPKPKKLNGLLKKDLSKGQTIKVEDLLFQADKSVIHKSSFKALNELYEFLAENEGIKAELGGHTNGKPGITDEYCDKLSYQRAKSVADFLVKKGISPDRLTYKGYGKRNPIGDNNTKAGRLKNQRVVIKILSLG